MTLDEAVEGGREERYGDAGAIVIDGDLDSVGSAAGRDRDGVRVTVLYGVGDRLVTMSMSPPGRPVSVVRGHSVRSATPDGPTARAVDLPGRMTADVLSPGVGMPIQSPVLGSQESRESGGGLGAMSTLMPLIQAISSLTQKSEEGD